MMMRNRRGRFFFRHGAHSLIVSLVDVIVSLQQRSQGKEASVSVGSAAHVRSAKSRGFGP